MTSSSLAASTVSVSVPSYLVQTIEANSFTATFQEKYGQKQPDGSYVVSSAWQSGLSNGALIGEILGLMACGIIAERFGYRFTIALALVLVVSLHLTCSPYRY